VTSLAPPILVDENIPRQFAAALRDSGITVIDAASVALGDTDASLLALAHREQAILVTGDLDFPRLIFAEHHAPPLILVVERRQPCDFARLSSDMMRIIKLGARLHGHVVVFDGDDERVRAFPSTLPG
jgi:predicted nuclease of predicted toxin-antitoxin system